MLALKNPPNIFWREVKRAKIACSQTVNSVNSQSIPKNIANDFKEMYAEIFRTGFTTENNLSELHSKLREMCKNNNWNPFRIDEVFGACCCLKPNKKDSNLMSNSAFTNAPHVFF